MRAENRKKKYEYVLRLRKEWEESDNKIKKDFSKKHSVSVSSLTKYLNMSDEEVDRILKITEYKKRKTDMDDYLNIVFKMLSDGYKPAMVYSYLLKIGYKGCEASLLNHIKAIALNNFKIRLGRDFHLKEKYADDIVIIGRFDVLKYITINDKEKMKDSDTYKYYEVICERYPVVTMCAKMWDDFHAILMGSDPDKLEGFLDTYENTVIAPFINGIKKDIAPVKNAISSSINSGFVEGGNCRYKATKRLMFGRSGLHHLFLKTYATSIIMRQGKSSSALLKNWLNN